MRIRYERIRICDPRSAYYDREGRIISTGPDWRQMIGSVDARLVRLDGGPKEGQVFLAHQIELVRRSGEHG